MSVTRSCRILILVGLVALPGPLDAQNWKDQLKQSILTFIELTSVSSDGVSIADPGSFLVVAKDGIGAGLATSSLTLPTSHVRGGIIRKSGGLLAALISSSSNRNFRLDERVYLSKVSIKDEAIELFLVSSETEAIVVQGSRQQARYRGVLSFDFPKGYLPTADFASVRDAIAAVFRVAAVAPPAAAGATTSPTLPSFPQPPSEPSPSYPGLPGWLVDAADLPIKLSGLATQRDGNLYVFGDFKQWTRVPSGTLLTVLGSTRSLDLTFLSAEDYRYRVKLAVGSGEALSTFAFAQEGVHWLLPRQAATGASGVAVREIAGTDRVRRMWQVENLRVVLRKTDPLSGLLSLQLADGTVKTLYLKHYQSDSATYAWLDLRKGQSLDVGSPLMPRPVAAFRLTSPGPLVLIVTSQGMECHDYRIFLVTDTEVRTMSSAERADFTVCTT